MSSAQRVLRKFHFGFEMAKKSTAKQKRFKTYLAAQTNETLVDMLLEVAQRDDCLMQSLLVKSVPPGKRDGLVSELRQVIDEVTYVDGFVDWRSMGSFSEPLNLAVETLAQLLTPERAGALVELAQYAIEQTEGALENVDDSSGQVGDILCNLGELHLKACKLARPDAVALAETLFRLETSLPFGVCSFSALTYKDVLGPKGLQRYRALAQAQWSVLTPVGTKTKFDHQRFRITHVMEQLATASGDVDELIAIKAQDLTHAHTYLTIAQILNENRRHEEALQWAERGLKDHPTRTDNRLRDFLIAAYLKRKRYAEALQLTWLQFEEKPGLEYYKKLHALAVKLGVWQVQRTRAHTCLDRAIAKETIATSRYQSTPRAPDTSRQVDIALWEGDLETAWAAAQNGHCQQNLRVSLAKALAATRGQDAIDLYRQLVLEIVGQTSNDAYARAINLVQEIQKLMTRLGQGADFAIYLKNLRETVRVKRNFVKLLDGMRVRH
jgi:tetratricopeptide (TPR) repeat protein